MNRLGFLIERSAARGILSLLFIMAALIPGLGWSAQSVLNFSSLSRGFGDMDPHGAVGPQGILAVCNNGVVYHSRTGAVIWSVTPEANFFVPGVCCDAKAVFDTDSQRFFVIAQQGDTNGNLFLHVVVSRSANPLSGSTNDWRRYRFFTGIFIDYPGIGIDAQALHVTYRNGLRWFRLNKAQLVSGGTNASTVTTGVLPNPAVYSQGVQAVSVIGSQSLGNLAYAVTMDTPTTVTLYAVTNILGDSTILVTNIPSPFYGNQGLLLEAPQPGTSQRLIQSSPVVMGNAFWRNGELWFCNAVASSNQPERTLIRYYKLNTGGFPNGQATLAESGDLDGGPNTWRMHPAIGGNTRGDVCLVYTQSSSNSLPAIYSSIRKAGQTSFETVFVKASLTNIINSARWADYSVVTPDPEDQTFWVSHIIITNQTTVLTWWANITADSLFYVDKNAVGAEIGTREFPYHTVRAAHIAASGAKTFVIKPASYPEPALPLRIDKTVRLENPYPSGTVRIGP